MKTSLNFKFEILTTSGSILFWRYVSTNVTPPSRQLGYRLEGGVTESPNQSTFALR
ncbi:hypothetical protein [Kamptonema sp. UHCC 0994]|uniref:hypothetical protein n=1 Tax=Kamptonema sp. UHCC 0994 TaxID=3031329 RepID=UPI0023B981D2|nr:hypothetical protein [Kamptonema sp. UHCC 0994]MDF0555477.1 hypothetical protein [Kamptonema sp. UHCC 0994]